MSFTSWRGVVGMVNPTMRPGMTEEVCRLLPEGIGLIPLFLNIRRGTEDEFDKMMPHYEKLVAVLAEQNCDFIHPNGAPPFMVHGFAGEAKIVAAWEKKYKVPIMSVAQNHVRALQALKAKSFVGATYFPDKLNAITTASHRLNGKIFHLYCSSVINSSSGFKSNNLKYVRGGKIRSHEGTQVESDVPLGRAVTPISMVRIGGYRNQ